MNNRIIIIEDHESTLQGIQGYLNKKDNIEVVGTTTLGEEGITLCEKYLPDIVIIDFHLVGGKISGMDVLAHMYQKQPEINTLIYSMFKRNYFVRKMLEFKASGFVHKNDPIEDLVIAIKKIQGGEQYFSPKIYHKMFAVKEEKSKQYEKFGRIKLLTRCELESFFWIGLNYTSDMTGKVLGKSKRTIDDYRDLIKEKLQVNSKKGVVDFAHESGSLKGLEDFQGLENQEHLLDLKQRIEEKRDAFLKKKLEESL